MTEATVMERDPATMDRHELHAVIFALRARVIELQVEMNRMHAREQAQVQAGPVRSAEEAYND